MRHAIHALAVLGVLLLLISAAPARAMELPAEGDVLKPFPIFVPQLAGDQAYLGVSGETFTLADIKAKLVVLEFSGVYCPICHDQAPYVRKLFKRIERSGLGGQVKLFSVAGGANQMEVDHARAQYNAPYPIIRDPEFAVHAALNEPKTPFTMLLRPDGHVLYAHLGRIADFDEFYQTIESLL